MRGVFHLGNAEAAVDFGVFHGGVQALQVVAEAVGFLLERASHFEYHISKHQGGVEDGDTGFAFGNEVPVEIDEALGHGETFRESQRWGNGSLYIRLIFLKFKLSWRRMAMKITEIEVMSCC